MKYFLDCGYYEGKALEYYAPFLDDSWRVTVFEPNMDLDVEESLEKFPFEIDWLPTAVWVEDGEVGFKKAGLENSYRVDEDAPKVPCIDFSRYVKKLPDDATIVVSMDIEGSEFSVLEKMIKEETIGKVDLLDVEFHHRLMSDYNEEDSQRLIAEIQGQGTLVKLKLEI